MEPTQSVRSKKKLGVGIAVVVAIVIIALVISRSKKDSSVATVTTTPTDTTTTTSTVPSSDTSNTIHSTPPVDTTKKNAYKDGTYAAVGSYMSPGGLDKLGVTLTLKSDRVTEVSLDMQPGDRTSDRYQNIFAANYKQYVIGKDISTLNLNKVSSSSLTPKGFNDAVAQIKLQAKA
jgi:hypothetical protein